MTFQQLDTHHRRYLQDLNYAHEFFQACLRFARTHTSATNPDREEIAHDAGWTALAKVRTLSPDTIFPVWFVRVVSNKKLDYARKASARLAYEQCGFDEAEPAFTPEERIEMCELSGQCEGLIKLLLAGNTLAQAAAELDMSERTARRHLNSLKQELTHA